MKKKAICLLVACVLAATMVCIGITLFVADKYDIGAKKSEKTPLSELSDEELLGWANAHNAHVYCGKYLTVDDIRAYIAEVEQNPNRYQFDNMPERGQYHLFLKLLIEEYYEES